MEWDAFWLSCQLAAATLVLLMPFSVWAGRALAYHTFRGKALIEGLVLLPLVLPPTVLGFYLLVVLGGASPLGEWLHETFGVTLVFNFTGLILASLLFNLPFVIPPVQRAFEAIDPRLREAARVMGLPRYRIFWQVELPLTWRALVAAAVLTFVHTLGEFGVVLMVGGNIPGETRTIAIAIYDRVQAFDLEAANQMALVLLLLSLAAVVTTFALSARATVPRRSE
ncbi:MAG: molybdate ABC transporter permease subunit [Hydrogenophilus thermoluteolus]